MTAVELDIKRMELFRMILNVKDVNVLTEIEELLDGINATSDADNSSYYSPSILHEAILRSEEDFRNGRTHTMEEVRKKRYDSDSRYNS